MKTKRLVILIIAILLSTTYYNLLYGASNDGIVNSTSIKIEIVPKSIIQNETVRDVRRRIVVSLSTIPSRIDYIRPTIVSIFNQTMKADTVYLVVGNKSSMLDGGKEREKVQLPNFIINMSDHGSLKVLQPEEDLGPVDKLVHALILERENNNTRILYLDDDMIYAPHTIQSLILASELHEQSAIAFSGAKLRSNFRQIRHSDISKDCHPNLYFYMGGLDCYEDRAVDIVQGFMGVVVQPRFFDIDKFLRLVKDASMPIGVRKSDDWLISSHLEMRNITRILVTPHDTKLDNTPQFNTIASKTNALSSDGMHENAMLTAVYLQERLEIWNDYTFTNVSTFSHELRELVYCEAGWRNRCPKGQDRNSATTKINNYLNINVTIS